MVSFGHHFPATAQITLTTEKSTTTGYPAGYREIPDVYKDDDGYYDSIQGCGGSGGNDDTCATVVKSTRPTVSCGTGAGLNTVNLRIADCLTLNPATAIWSGGTKGISGEASWKLVTLTSDSKEVWRDERTGLLWGDMVVDFWCHASGNGQSDGFCDANLASTCAEAIGLTPSLAGENWSSGVYDNSKGGMGAIPTSNSPSVRWRLPTRSDWMQAEIDGARYVMPNMLNSFWSATVVSYAREEAWFFNGYNGVFSSANRSFNNSLRCLGR